MTELRISRNDRGMWQLYQSDDGRFLPDTRRAVGPAWPTAAEARYWWSVYEGRLTVSPLRRPEEEPVRG